MTSSVSRTSFSLTKKVQPELCALARSISRMTSDPDRKPAVGLRLIARCMCLRKRSPFLPPGRSPCCIMEGMWT